jgi:CTP synthase (UTP-ammonia lyase)
VLASCAIAGRPDGTPRLYGKLRIKLKPGSLAIRTYQQPEIQELFNCNYELNPEFQTTLESTGLQISGLGDNGEARIIELSDHRFFLATAFQPQFSSEEGRPHPLIVAYLKAALVFQKASQKL